MAATGRRFLIDATMARVGGGYTYVVNLLPELARLAPEDAFLGLVRGPDLLAALPPEPNLEVTDLEPAHGGVARRVWRLRHLLTDAARIAARWRADLYFSVAELVPFSLRCPTVASFRNPNVVDRKRHHWPLYQRMRLRALRRAAMVSARRCERIVFVSEDSARWMGDDLGLPEAKRTVIHHGIDPSVWREPVATRRRERPYILSVSSVYRYKNFVRLIEAFSLLARRVPQTPDLLIVGDDQDPPYSRRMEAARRATGALAERIHIEGRVPYEDVRGYYAGASLFVFPSYLETFGHPLLEAMASGLPTVASDIPVFREIAGDAVLYADPHDTASLAAAMERALAPDLSPALRARAEARALEFSWKRSAERHLALFRDLC